MKTVFKSALDKIKAEDKLVEKTEEFLTSKMHVKKRDIWTKRLLVASVVAVFMLGAVIGTNAYLNTPVAYISIDINPSIELGVNAFDKVVTAEGINEDGQSILADVDIKNKDVTEVITNLIDTAAEQDYIKDDGTTVVSITAETNDNNEAEKLTDIGEQAVNTAMEKRKINAIVYKDCSDLTLRTEAKDLGISPGKYKLIKNVQALDPTITIDDLKDEKVSDIMLRAHQLIDELDIENSDCPEEQQKVIKKMKETAKRTEERIKNSVNAEFEAAKEQAKVAFDEVKNQATTIKQEAIASANNLKEQAKALIDSSKNMTEEEKAVALAKAEELRKQAEALVQEAEKQAEELKDAAEKQKDEAIEAAEKAKKDAESAIEKAKQKKEDKQNNGNNNNKKDESEVTEPETTEPETTEPVTSEPETTEPVTTEPETSDADEFKDTTSRAQNNGKDQNDKGNNGDKGKGKN